MKFVNFPDDNNGITQQYFRVHNSHSLSFKILAKKKKKKLGAKSFQEN